MDSNGGKHSPFTAALLKHIERPGLDIRLLFGAVRDEVMSATRREQVPHVHGALGVAAIHLRAPLAATEATETTASREPPVHDCDRLAAHPDDRAARAPGTKFKDLQPDTAIAACEAALAQAPNTSRFAHQLGRAYEAVKRNGDALSAFRLASDKGHMKANVQLGRFLAEGIGGPRDYAAAARLLRLAADNGEVDGLYNLALMFRDGKGVPRDDMEAFRLFYQAAETGASNAIVQVSIMYEKGRGVGRDDGEAIRYLRLAAEKGNALAMANLGNRYFEGRGVTQSEVEAVRRWRLGAEKGHAIAMYNLATMYRNGRGGLTVKFDEAARWCVAALTAPASDALPPDQMIANLATGHPDVRRAIVARLKLEGRYGGPVTDRFTPAVIATMQRAIGSRQ